MNHGPRIKKTRHCRPGKLASGRAGLPAIQGVRGVVAAGCKTSVGSARAAWPKRIQERRHQPGAEGNGGSRLVKPVEPWGCSSGTAAVWAIGANPAGFADGLQSVRLHPVPAGLRFGKAGCETRLLPDHGLHAAGHACKTSDRIKPGNLEARQKNTNGSPATGRSIASSSHHGTKCQFETMGINDFVPPRDKTTYFSGLLRPATGHLYRFTICVGVSEGGINHG